jgi:ankyrin repeat protein
MPALNSKHDTNQRLIVACHRVDVEGVTRALRDGADVNARYGNGAADVFFDQWERSWPFACSAWTPLIALASSSRYPAPPRLIHNTNADIAWAKEQKMKITQEAFLKRENDASTILHILLSHGCNLNDDDGKGATALYEAVKGKHENIAATLLNFGANPNTKVGVYIDPPYSQTPLHEAYWSLSLTKLLLDAGADTTAIDSNGCTPWDFYKSYCEDPNILKLYNERQPFPSDEKLKAALTEMMMNTITSAPFDAPIEEELITRISNILSSGVDVNARDTEGNTALLKAARHFVRPGKVFKILLVAGADSNAQNNEGDTALHMMVHWGEVDIEAVRLLLDRGISVTATNQNGDTAFAWVASALDNNDSAESSSSLVFAKLLLAAGADKWQDYMGAQITVIPDPPKQVIPIVASLSDPAQRDTAFRTILSWQKYRSKDAGVVRIFKPLRHVVVCPQKEGPSIYAAFQRTPYEQRALPKGSMTLIDGDGAIIDLYYLDDHSEFRDINGDGVLDLIDPISTTDEISVLQVFPVTRRQSPSLNILIREKGFDEAEWSWRLCKTDAPDIWAIEVGPIDPTTKELTPKAVYKWSKESQQYVGPQGGDNLSFKRISIEKDWISEEYDSFKAKKREEAAQ